MRVRGLDGPVPAARQALQALLAGDAAVAADVGEAFAGPAARLDEAALARALRAGVAVAAIREASPTLLRALRERPPALLIVTGAELPEAVPTRTLGPAARVVIGSGEDVLLAADAPALAGLLAAFEASPALALCPTPAWAPEWLAAPELAGRRAAGTVAAAVLDAGWASWAQAAGPRQVVVPLGVEPARVEAPRDPSLARAAAAHALERLTGPVFPEPGVIARLCRKEHVPGDMTARARLELAWRQARRALPGGAAEPGMEAPRAELSPGSTAEVFLAQRALVRREQGLQALAAGATLTAPTTEAAAVARAEEVIRAAGQVLSEHESKVVLRGFGLEITRQAVASSASGAAQFAETIGFPVVLKAVSPDLRRKREIGAVVLDLTTAAAVRRAYAAILTSVEAHAPTARVDGVMVAEQVPEGPELHCGAVALASGEAALFVRALGPAAPAEHLLCLSPLTPPEALLLASRALAHVPLRRREDPEVRGLALLFLRLDALLRHFGAAGAEGTGRLELVELGPVRLVAGPRGYVILDARIVQRPHLEGL